MEKKYEKKMYRVSIELTNLSMVVITASIRTRLDMI